MKEKLKSLSQTIHSLLGFKTQTTTGWAYAVCDIIKGLPSTADYENDPDDLANDRKHNLDDFAISKIHGELAALTEEVFQLNAQRRQILNDFLQLKGNIRVFCRVRPIIGGENFGHRRPVVPVDSIGILLNFAENKTKTYNFDKVFQPSSSQDEVFSEIEPVIKSALDGYNVCILAYGQTGTGKTFTMEGSPDSVGVIPRTIEALFKQTADSNHKYLLSFSMLEIYLGHVRDLLVPQAKKPTDPMSSCLSIQTDPNGGIAIDNLVTIQVSNFNHAISLYRLGRQSRSTASTNSNKTSSRSHCMIRMLMTCPDATVRRKLTNKIWMVDLGGSERVLKTKACGRRFEEGKAINLSLSALGDVINALQRKKSHIPYRNSKLTQVLKDSLGEDSKTLMLVHISPKEEDLCETICSLNFALRLRSVHLGKSESNEVRAKREAAMTNLQQRMQQIEDNRDNCRREIKRLNQKLEYLTKKSLGSNEKLDESHSSMEVPLLNAEIVEKTGIIAKPPSSKIPRFMRPTICSSRKSGTGHQASYEKDMTQRRKELLFSRAESVSFPVKGMTESCSENSISRVSCLVDFNGMHNAGNDTEYSQDTSEYNFRMDIDKRDIISKNSTDQSVHSSLSEDIEFSSTKFSNIDNWLHLHKNTTNGNIYAHQNKRVLAIPTQLKKSKVKEPMEVETASGRDIKDHKFAKKKHKHGHLEKLSNRRTTDMLISDKPRFPWAEVNFVGEGSRFDSIQPILVSDKIKGMTSVDDPTTEYTCRGINQCNAVNDQFHQGSKNDNGIYRTLTQVMTHRTKYSEASKLEGNLSTSVPSNAIGLVESSKISVSRAELRSPSKKVPTDMGENCAEQHMCVRQSETGNFFCLCELRTQNFLSMDNLNQKDHTALSSEFHSNRSSKGLCDLLKEKIQILYIGFLLGLGFQSLGFDHDFFQALTL